MLRNQRAAQAALALLLAACSVKTERLGSVADSPRVSVPTGDAGARGEDAAMKSVPSAAIHDASDGSAHVRAQDAGMAACAVGRDGGEATCDPGDEFLESYCRLEFTKCPRTLAEGQTVVCANTVAKSRARFANTCGGVGLRVTYEYGELEYYYDAGGKLAAVTTSTPMTSGPCHTLWYRYGNTACAAMGADTQPMECM